MRFPRFTTSELVLAAIFVAVWLALFAYTQAQGLIGLQPDFISGDAAQYNTLALSLLRHGIYSTDGITPFFEREPGYSFFLTMIYAVGGAENFTLVYIVQGLLHAFASLIFMRTISSFVSHRAALITLALLLVFPAVWHVIFSLTRESLALSLSLLFASAVLHFKSHQTVVSASLAGFLLGVLFLTYAVFLLFPIVLVGVLWLWKVRPTLIAVCFLICIAVMGVWGARNYAHLGKTCMTGCYREALQWYVRGEQSKNIGIGLEPLRCLQAEYITRDWSSVSEYCSFNAVWHKKWPEGFVGVPEDEAITTASKRDIIQHLPNYLWFSLFEVFELHFPYVNGWGKAYNVLALISTFIVYVGVAFSWRSVSRGEHLFFAAILVYTTGIFALTDATPRYFVPVVFVYLLWGAMGYDRFLYVTGQYRHSGV